MMRRTCTLLLAICLLLTICCPLAQAQTQVQRSSQTLLVNDESVSCEAYNIDGNNYFRLRDVAHLLNGTTSQFSVGWDPETRTVTVITGEGYTDIGSELESGADQSATAIESRQTICINGIDRDNLSVYNIGGSNYFQLEQLGGAVNFDVDYDSETRTVSVTSVPISRRGGGLAVTQASSQLDEHPNRAIRRSTTPIEQILGTLVDGSTVPSDFYIYRNALSDTDKQAYDQIHAGLAAAQSTITMTVPVSTNDICDIFYMVVNEHPEMIWTQMNVGYSYNNYGNVTSVTPHYNSLVGDATRYLTEMQEATKDVLAEMWALGSDIERVKYAHDYLVDTITYQFNDLDQVAYSALVWKKTVCAGYSKAFTYLMQKVGIPCVMLIGDAGGPHGWNLLQLDGEYYIMDVTWDDPTGAVSIMYNYFNITDQQVSADHTRNGISLRAPAANGTAYSYTNTYGNPGWAPTDSAGNSTGDYGDNTGDYGDDTGDYGDNTEDYGDDTGDYGDDTGDYGDGWWSALNDSWSQDDWSYDEEDGTWVLFDDTTFCFYYYDPNTGMFYCMDWESETMYMLTSTGEWMEIEY